MTEPEKVQFRHGHPMPVREHATLLASYRLLLDLAGSCLPVRVARREQTTPLEDWEVVRAAFVARMAGTLRHLSYLAPSYSRLDGFALARTLVDHVITFAWISANPKDHLPAFLHDSFSNLLGKDERSRSRGRGPLLNDDRRENLRELTERIDQRMPRKLLKRASKADAHWVEKAETCLPETLQIIGLKGLYHDVYDHYSTYDHPSTTGLISYVHIDGAPAACTVDGKPERDGENDLRPYWIAMWAFAEALVISNLASRHPRLDDLRPALEQIGTMRELERAGRLAVTVHDDGAFVIDVASEAEEDGSAPAQ